MVNKNHLFNKYVLRNYCKPDTVLDAGDISGNKTDKNHYLREAYILARTITKK